MASSLAAFLLVALSLLGRVHGIKTPTALFVFGDSYVDTGNHEKREPGLYRSWRAPYGQSWPGKPSGRFSDGKVLTDNIASFLNIPPPLPYVERKLHACKVSSGMNFAIGMSGASTKVGPKYPTIREQIHRLKKLLKLCPQTKELIQSSMAMLDTSADIRATVDASLPLVDVSLPIVDVSLPKKTAVSARKLHNLGFRKFIFSNMEPIGCVPRFTSGNNYSKCNETLNNFSVYHNTVISKQIEEISKLPDVQIISIDQHKAFLAALEKFGNYLEPCCKGFGSSSCGDVDAKGKPLFTVCSNSEDAFFWDEVHPTQAGWKAVSETYRHLLKLDE